VPMRVLARLRPVVPLLLAAAVLTLTGCAAGGDGTGTDRADLMARPEDGACRLLTAEDVARPSNETATVPCTEDHTAQTYAVGDLPASFADAEYDDPALGRYAYQTCAPAFRDHIGADESLVMRTVLSWAWFRPSEEAWREGARWYRCDVIGGGPQIVDYVLLPPTTGGLLLRPEDAWLVCVNGPTVSGSVKIPCSQPHTWRAVTTIKLGEPDDEYPGDRVVEVRTRDFCSDSVGAWLGYPVNYDFGYTWFHEAEWEAGNRRSVCWAKTDR
jgi:Septum formation